LRTGPLEITSLEHTKSGWARRKECVVDIASFARGDAVAVRILVNLIYVAILVSSQPIAIGLMA
jgi:hypothetical protein